MLIRCLVNIIVVHLVNIPKFCFDSWQELKKKCSSHFNSFIYVYIDIALIT